MSKLGATEELLEAETRSGTDEKACGRLTYDWVVADYHPAHLNRYPERRVEWRGRQLERGRARRGLARRRDVAGGLARWRLARAPSLLWTPRLPRGRRRRSLL